MTNIKFGAFFLGLTLAVVAAVSVAAQDRMEPRRDVRIFEGGGTQLGISVSDTATGVRVDDVRTGGPAEKAGIREGDVLVEFDGERVRSAMQLTRLVRETPDGRQVAVAVMRDGKRQTLQATPEAGTAGEFAGGDFMRELERGWRAIPREFEFRYDDRPRRFEYRLPERFEFSPDMMVPFMGSRGRLGLTIQSLTPELEEYFGAKNGGALVSSVSQNSAAAKAGIRAGDVIVSIDGRSVSDSGDLMRKLRALQGEITIVVLRDKKEVTLKATLTDEPKSSSLRRREIV
jgi:S1-C subfamily serine protease